MCQIKKGIIYLIIGLFVLVGCNRTSITVETPINEPIVYQKGTIALYGKLSVIQNTLLKDKNSIESKKQMKMLCSFLKVGS